MLLQDHSVRGDSSRGRSHSSRGRSHSSRERSHSSRERSHSSEGGEGQMDTLVRLPPIHICTCTNLTSSIHLHTFTLSHSHTITHTFHSSSSLLICEADIWRALACSLSEGIFTNQLRKQRSWISGCHCEGFLGRGREGGKEGGDERVEGEK